VLIMRAWETDQCTTHHQSAYNYISLKLVLLHHVLCIINRMYWVFAGVYFMCMHRHSNADIYPQTALLGGIPTISVDVPICAVFIAIFAAGSVLNAMLFFKNRRRSHKFFISWILNAFCLVRIVTCAMRIAWARDPLNRNLAIAAQVFNNAGILIIYVSNLVFAQRILRGMKPTIGWHKTVGIVRNAFFGLMAGAFIMGVVSLGISINTTNPDTLQAIRSVTLASVTFLVVVTVLPLLPLAIACLPPKSSQPDPFGSGSMATKVYILLTSTLLSIVISGFKAGTAWEPPRSIANPAWYHSKAAFYCLMFVLEIAIITLFLLTRVDKRFYIPADCKGPGDYSRIRSEDKDNSGNTTNESQKSEA
jgi:hypothetical protein